MHSSSLVSCAILVVSLLAVGCSSGDEAENPTAPTHDAGVDAEPDAATDAEPDADAVPDTSADTAADAVDDTFEASDVQPSCAPPDEMPSVGPGGFPMDGWAWTRHGVVLEDPAAAAQGGYIAPAAVVLDGTIHLWVTHKEGTTHRIHHSTSTDGLTFTAPQATSGIAGENIVAYPSVLHDGARFLMWYGSGTIDHAESQDGVAWTMIETMVLKTGEDGEFDSLSLLYPNVIATPSGYVMHYTGYNGAAFAIGRAESPDGVTWTRSPSGPIITAGSATEFDNHAAAQPCAVTAGARTLLWYGGYDTSVANPGPYRVGLAASTDGVSYQKLGVTLDLEPSGEEAWSTRDPAVVRWNGQWWMAYVAMGDDGTYRIAVATSDTCGD